MILVVGGTGLVGGTVCSLLARDGIAARALVRATSDPAKVEHLHALGLETVEGDLRDPASLRAACEGVDALICTVSSMPFTYEPGVNDIETTDRAGVLHLVDAAVAAGVGHFVYTSFSANLDLEFPLGQAKRAVEQHLMASGMGYTILRPSCFMEVWLSPAVGFDPGAGTVTLYGTGAEPVSYIAVQDVARFAVASLTAPGARNAVLELGGPRPVSQAEAAEIFGRAAGRPVATTNVPVDALLAQADGTTDGMQRSFAMLMACVAKGDPIDMGSLPEGLPSDLTSVEEYAARQFIAA
ncbi:MAG TPA: NmrA family NAD(P)-binding protein [Candidatus Nanopelagicales bacterium]